MATRSVNRKTHTQTQRHSLGLTAKQLESARSRLIFALDVASIKEVDRYVDVLAGEVGLFKVGKQLFVHAGPDIVRRITAKNCDVFLDLKFHDIPQTVASASAEAARLGVKMLTLHASGGADMLQQASKKVRTVCRSEGLTQPTLLAVTVLTSLGHDDLNEIGHQSQTSNPGRSPSQARSAVRYHRPLLLLPKKSLQFVVPVERK